MNTREDRPCLLAVAFQKPELNVACARVFSPRLTALVVLNGKVKGVGNGCAPSGNSDGLSCQRPLTGSMNICGGRYHQKGHTLEALMYSPYVKVSTGFFLAPLPTFYLHHANE